MELWTRRSKRDARRVAIRGSNFGATNLGMSANFNALAETARRIPGCDRRRRSIAAGVRQAIGRCDGARPRHRLFESLSDRRRGAAARSGEQAIHETVWTRYPAGRRDREWRGGDLALPRTAEVTEVM